MIVLARVVYNNAMQQPERLQENRVLPDIVRDRFSRARGGNSELLSLSCTRCNTEVMVYQKDGKGGLVRCYFDRMYLPKNPMNHFPLERNKPLSQLPNLHCPSCNTVIGTPMMFNKEHRLAYRVIRGTLAKKRLK